MYIVTINNNILHDPRIKDYQVLNPVLNLEINKAHSFNFTIYPNNPMFNSIKRLKSIIGVFDDGELIFRGRPLNDTADFNKATTIQCEGELAYLNDSTMEPYSYFGALRGLLELYIDNHNAQVDASKRFTLGTVNVTGDFVRSNIEYTNTWEELSAKTFGSGIGGYLRLRRDNSINYIDYLNDSPYISGQTIELSKNLLDYEKTVNAGDIVTVLIPLGAKLKDEEGNETDERLTIESVNNGSKFIEHTSGISKYGRIVGYKVWDDINSPSLLKTRADNDLNFLVNLGISIKIKAIDLNILDKSIPKIRFFEYVKIISKPHEIDDSMLIKKQTIHLDDPSQNTIEVGVEVSSFTDKQLEANNTIKKINSDYVTNEKITNIVTPLTNQLSEIIQESDQIKLSVSELRTEVENIDLKNITTEVRNYILNSMIPSNSYEEVHLSEPTETGITYTFSVETVVAGALEFEFFKADSSDYQIVTMPSGTRSITVEFTDNWERFYQTEEITITKSWLTKSNHQMGWTPAPEDSKNEIKRIETETNAKIEANTEGIFLEKSERETQYGNLGDVVNSQGTSLKLLNDQINTTIEKRLTNAEGTIENLNDTISTVESTQQTFTNRLTNLEGDMVEQQTFFRTGIDGLFIGGTDWETVMQADGEKISFVNQTGSIQAHFGANGMYTNRWELDYHTIEKFEEGTIRGTIFKNRRSGS